MRGVSKDGRERLWPILQGSPLRGERLRMTAAFVGGHGASAALPALRFLFVMPGLVPPARPKPLRRGEGPGIHVFVETKT